MKRTLLVAVVLVAGALLWLRSSHDAAPAGLEPRAILNRPWFDNLPKTPRDEVKLLIFFGGGIGVYQSGSTFRGSIDVFDFERQGDRLAVTLLQDKRRIAARFEISRCDDKPPFNVCLELNPSPGGPRRYYGFISERELDAQVPWAAKAVRAARAQAEVR